MRVKRVNAENHPIKGPHVLCIEYMSAWPGIIISTGACPKKPPIATSDNSTSAMVLPMNPAPMIRARSISIMVVVNCDLSFF